MRMRLLNIYRQRLAKYTRLFEGGDEMLDALEERGLAWGIVTNKPGWLTDPLLIEVKLHDRVRAVVSGDTLSERKPHPAAAAARREDHRRGARRVRVRRRCRTRCAGRARPPACIR